MHLTLHCGKTVVHRSSQTFTSISWQ